MPEYEIVYETDKFQFNLLVEYIIFIFIILVFGFIIFCNVRRKITLSGETQYKNVIIERVFSLIGLIVSVSVFSLILVQNITDYNFITKNICEGNYEIVEGEIENFIPMKKEGHSQESFDVDGVTFIYNRSNPKHGYHFPNVDGGYITNNGQYVRITYINYNGYNIIIRLETKKC